MRFVQAGPLLFVHDILPHVFLLTHRLYSKSCKETKITVWIYILGKTNKTKKKKKKRKTLIRDMRGICE